MFGSALPAKQSQPNWKPGRKMDLVLCCFACIAIWTEYAIQVVWENQSAGPGTVRFVFGMYHVGQKSCVLWRKRFTHKLSDFGVLCEVAGCFIATCKVKWKRDPV